jgi:LysR family transcriptional regulator (chromosome initiation inhibitor)
MLLRSGFETFLAVFELASVSAAARKLGVTQAAATQRLRALEREVGASLFTRSRSGMRPTPEGLALRRVCLEVRNLEGNLASVLRKGESADVGLTITGSASMIAGRIVPAALAVMGRWPRLSLSYVIDVNANRLDYLRKGTADFGLVFPHEVPREMDSKLLAPLEFLLVCTPRWRRRALPELLGGERLFAYYEGDTTGLDYLRQYGLLGHVKRPRQYVNELSPLLQLLEGGAGFGVLAREIAAPLLKEGRLVALNEGRSMKVRFALAWYPRDEMPKYFKDVIAAIR